MVGPLQGIKVLEIASIGPGPFCAMMLADMGAEVIRIDRRDRVGSGDPRMTLNRGRKSLALDLKKPEAVGTVLRLVAKADMLIEGFRPGVMERLGLGPESCLARNPRLIFGRMTGWGQQGPLAQAAGHDINYIALAGALHAMGSADRPPTPPLNLVGDFGGGAMYLLAGLLAAYIETQRSGRGQVVDAAMTDGTASLLTAFFGLRAMGQWSDRRAGNRLDGGAHYYGCYACADGKFVSIGSIEPQFYALLLEKLGIEDPEFENQNDQSKWSLLRSKLETVFLTRDRDQWCQLLENTDVCFAPVLSMEEASRHPHNLARKTYVEIEGVVQPAPAPRFSRTAGEIQGPAATVGQHSEEVLRNWGFSAVEIADLRAVNAL
ncbi:MAG: CaiB/BaiF CoA-transferase family protein [Gammaproteobacteria bacterium]|nr:CoA transferase [Pseudomonadales bacterium]MCP5345935.1 CoA transferase [Pseudomonadales bacterium]